MISIPCPDCCQQSLVDTEQKTFEKQYNIAGINFAEGQAVGGQSSQKVIIVKCGKCSFAGIMFERNVSFVVRPK